MAPKVSQPTMIFIDNNSFLALAGEVASSLLEHYRVTTSASQAIVMFESLQLSSILAIPLTTVAVLPPLAPPLPKTGWKNTNQIN